MIKLSLFKGFSDVTSRETSLDAVVAMVRCDGGIRESTEKVRVLRRFGDHRAADHTKSSTPCFAVAVRFAPEGKSRADVLALTGLSLVDIDHIAASRMSEVRALVEGDPHTLLCYTTISGEGLRIIFRVDGLEDSEPSPANMKVYAAAFAEGNRHYAAVTGCECDLKCKNATRLSGIAHDADVFFNPAAEAFSVAVTPPAVAVNRTRSGRKVSPRLLAAIHGELSAQGLSYRAHHRNEYVMRVGYLMNAYGVGLEAATTWAVSEYADYDGDVAAVLRSCYQHTDEFGTRRLAHRKAEPSKGFATVAEIEQFLATQGQFRHNTVTGKTEWSAPPLSSCSGGSHCEAGASAIHQEIDDRFVNSLWSRMSKQGSMVKAADIRMVLQSEFVPAYNPFESYFESLPAWDGTSDHISALADTVIVRDGEQEFFRRYFKKWLVAMVASVMERDVVNHEILVFIGPQGCYKTTWMNRLLPPELRRYFYVKTNSSSVSKDDHFSLTEFAIICLEELDELRTTDMNQLKALVSKPEVNERAAYGHYKERRPHLASFCGTTNNVQFLTDLTGNRRWLPVEVERILDPFCHPVNYTGVYSQALALFRSGFPYYLSPQEVAEVNKRNHRFEVPCLEVELIQMLYRVPTEGESEAKFVSTAHILHRINGWVKHLLSPTKIGIAMAKAGFTPLRRGGKRGYRVVELDAERVIANQRIMARE